MIGIWVDRLVRRQGRDGRGGTGSRAEAGERAVIICGVNSIWEGVEAQRAYLTEQFGDRWEIASRVLFTQEGRHFERFMIRLSDGTHQEIVFDIASFFGARRW